MRIKSFKKKKLKTSILNYFFKTYFFISTILIFLFFVLFFNTGYWSNYKDKFLSRLYISSVNNYIYLPEILVNRIKAKFYKVPQINLNISFENQINLEKQRIEALKSFRAGDDSTVFTEVNGSVNFNNLEIKTNIRFKGDRESHWFDKDQASYKLNLKGKKKLLGMEKFSLQKPRMRNYIHEWLYFELLGELDLIKLNYDFINLSINGANSQLYAIEESFDKIVVERNKKRNGPIFSIYEEFTHDIQKIKFQVYNKKYWLNEENLQFTQNAKQKLNTFFKNKNKKIDIFDEEKWANFFAVTDLNYYAHGRAYKSVRFFYNPVSASFEPIGYDGHRSVPNYNTNIKSWLDLPMQNSFQDALTCKNNLEACIKASSRKSGNYLVYRFFFNENGSLNKNFYQKYRDQVINISSKNFLDNFFSKRKKKIEKINALIYDDYFFVDHNYFYGPGIYYFSKKDIYLRAESLKQFFKKNPEKIFVEQEDNRIIISNILNNNLGLNLKQISCKDTLTSKTYLFEINKKINEDFTIIKLSDFESVLRLKCLIVSFSDGNNYNFEKIVHQNLDANSNNFKEIGNDLFKKYFNIVDNNLFLRDKDTVINENIVIPKNYTVIILPGEKLTLKDNSFIYSYSAWNVDGKVKKIIITGLKDNFGGGIFIRDEKKKSIFNNVAISYLSGPGNIMNNYPDLFSMNKAETDIKNNAVSDKNLYDINHILYGALNFYNTKIFLKNVNFKKICSEDALNIISSNFLIENVFFEDNCSDSIDVDFGKGKIMNSNFKNIGNDAIDFSGSNVEILNVFFENIGDKLVSVGENSTVKITDLVGSKSKIGIATKDGSLSILENIKISNTKIGLASYNKKNEYDPGKIIASKFTTKDVWKDWLTDGRSQIIVDNKKLNSSEKNLLELIYEE